MDGRTGFRIGRMARVAVLAAVLVLALLPAMSSAAPGQGGGPPEHAPPADSPRAQPPGRGQGNDLQIEVLSSPPEFVSGGDARLLVHVPDDIDPAAVEVVVDGRDVTQDFSQTDAGDLEGVVAALPPGDVEVVARAAPSGANNRNPRGRARGQAKGWNSTSLTLTNHPIGGPMFSGPQQQPFGCTTEGDLAETGVGEGPRLHEADQADDCAMDTLVSFLYRPAGQDAGWAHYDPEDPPASGQVATTSTIDGEEVPLIVRWERGTINRFVYSIAVPVPAPSPGDEDRPADLSNWNDRLMYRFQGGVGIGHYQGEPDASRMLDEFGLSDGYAVAYSTGTKTGVHYNLQVGGETAIMVKDRFVSAYDDPRYTVGLGASGGAIQQYVYGQNHPGLIDAAIPVQSYPDMITQTIHVGDCELLERWMDQQVLAAPEDDPSMWGLWSNRRLLEGLNAVDAGVTNELAPLMPWMPTEGASECRNAWLGLSALALNPNFGDAPGVDQGAVEWTHYGDAVNIYGENEDGFANRTWDNVGVQYGLQALRDDDITPEQFLDLNWNVGSWKNEPEMVQEGCPYVEAACGAGDVDIWSRRNMNLAEDAEPAPRAAADPGAIEAAHTSGLVFRGDIDIPVIDWRPYLEPELDMHNAHQSFAARQRMLDHDGEASNQVIWFTMGPESDHPPQVTQALHVMDEWMANVEAHPQRGVAGNRPDAAVDRCFDASGAPMATGEDVWDGVLDDGPAGACTDEFPIHSQSRAVAGGPITGDVFQCELQSVEAAVDRGVYGDWDPTGEELATLREIFPDGVCDFASRAARGASGP